MSDDLVKRLRGPIAEAAQAYKDAWFNNRDTQRPVHSIPAKESDTDLTLAMGIKEAADRIEELEAQLEAAEAERDQRDGVIRAQNYDYDRACAERDCARAKLEKAHEVFEEIEGIAVNIMGEITPRKDK